MGKVKIKRKSTLIDMTAMSDVTVLLLTFFMLTSTFLAKEPTVVVTPSSVSEEKVPMNNLVTILVSGKDKPGNAATPGAEGKVFISITGDKDSTYSSEYVRGEVLDRVLSIYNAQQEKYYNGANKVVLNDKQKSEFKKLNMFGMPIAALPAYLDLDQTKRDKIQGDMTRQDVGIPIDTAKIHRERFLKGKNELAPLNEFQMWMEAIHEIAEVIEGEQAAEGKDVSESLFSMIRGKGDGIAVKADKNTPYKTVFMVFDNLRIMHLNKFSLMTSLKSEDEPTN